MILEVQIHLDRMNTSDAFALRCAVKHPLIVRYDQPDILPSRFLVKTDLSQGFRGWHLPHVNHRKPEPGKLVEQPSCRQPGNRMLQFVLLEPPGHRPYHLITGPRRDVATHYVVSGKVVSLAPCVQHRVVISDLHGSARLAPDKPLLFQMPDNSTGEPFVQPCRLCEFPLSEGALGLH